MKKNTLIILLFFVSIVTNAQLLTENFDSGIPGTWTVTDAGAATGDSWITGVIGGDALDGSDAAFVNSDANGNGTLLLETLTSPVFDSSGTSNLLLEFDQYYRHLGAGSAKVEVYDGTIWVEVLNLTATAGAFNTPDSQIINITSYSNANMQIRFVYDDGDSWAWYWLIDNVKVSDVSCPGPLNINITNISDVSAQVNWTQGGSETTWDVAVQTQGTGTPTAGWTSETSPYTLNGLTASTDYEVYIRSTCGGSEGNSDWAGPINFSTSVQTNFSVDCAGAPITLDYCYTSNDSNVFTYTSTDGSPLNITFNSGQVETNWDELLVFDSDGTTDLNAATPYGNAGDVSGLTYQSSGDSISFTIQSDGSFSCDTNGFTPINVTIACATCENPQADYTVVSNCAVGPEFFIDVNVTNLGSASSLTVVDNQGNSNTSVTALGVIQFGPYPNNTNVEITVTNNDDGNCFISSSPLTQEICLDNIVDCAVGSTTVDYCYAANDSNVFTFTSTDGSPLRITFNSGQVESNFDELLVFDSDGTTDLNAATPYGNAGDVSGLIYQSSGDTISFAIQSDGSVSCSTSNFTPINAVVTCATCDNPEATFSVVSNCVVGAEFFIETDVTNLGSASSLTVSDNQGNINNNVVATGVIQFGPFANGTNVDITISNNDDSNCVITSSSLTQDICLDTYLDCASGTPIDFNYCYTANDTNLFTFSSDNGFPVTITFNSGSVEDGFDELIILDTDGTQITPIGFYGNNGDLSGLSYTSTGDTLSFQIASDGFASCDTSGTLQEINATVICQTCITPSVTFTANGDCSANPDAPEFFIDVDITDFGSVGFVQVADNQGNPGQLPTAPGVLTFGPYPAGLNVIIEVSTDDINCIELSEPLTIVCPEPPNDCSMIYAGPDQTLDCDTTTTNLEAIFQVTGQDTTVYEINALDSCPTPPISGGTPTSLEIDDRWSDAIDMEFDFCFFGDTYNQLIVGANGGISFDVSNAGGPSGWSFDEPIPNATNNTLATVNIFAAYHDINPQTCGEINYVLLGSAPSRQFIINYNDVCQFSCDDQLASMQVILYEGSNNIDINVFNKPQCDWNSGSAVIGVQNMTADIAFAPADRNTGDWTAVNEFYRFSPGASATPNYIFEWYDDNGLYQSSDQILEVSPTETTTYTATMTYTQCAGPNITVTDQVTITVPERVSIQPVSDLNICDDDNDGFAEFDLTLVEAELLGTQTGLDVTYHNTLTDAETAVNAIASPTSYTNTTVNTELIFVRVVAPTDGCFAIESFTINVLATPIVQPVSDLNICDDDSDGFTEFDLTLVEAELLGTQTGLDVTYHNTLTDAEMAVNAIASPMSYINTTVNTELIYIRVVAPTDECFAIESFSINVLSTPNIQPVSDLNICDDDNDGFAEFDLTLVEAELLGTQTGLDVTYHNTLTDAETAVNAIVSATSYTNTTVNTELIYVRVVAPTDVCFAIESFSINVLATPIATIDTSIAYEVCPNATQPITISAIASNFNESDVSISWDLDGAVLPGETSLDLNSVLLEGDYTITVTNTSTSCSASETVSVLELDSCVIPQGISPNNDGLNDRFDLSSFDVQSLEIFNRNGRKVYVKNNGYKNEWFGQTDNGDELPTGTYYYVMRFNGDQVKASYVYINR